MVKLLNIMSFLALLIFNAQRAILSYKSGNAILLQRISDRFDCDKRLNYGQWKVYWLIIVPLLLFCVHPRYECLSLSIVCDLLWHAYRILFTKPIPAVNCTNCCTHTEHRYKQSYQIQLHKHRHQSDSVATYVELSLTEVAHRCMRAPSQMKQA